jgi:hypothetical protein
MLAAQANAALVRAIRSMPRIPLQNRLMRLAARELAVAMRLMGEVDRSVALGVLPAPMAARVREEISLQRRRRVSERDYLRFVRQVLASLERESAPPSIGSYIRPRPRGEDR